MISANRPKFLNLAFEQLLNEFDIETIHVSENIVYGLHSSFALAYLNEGWMRFAEQNGGLPDILRNWGIGRSILDAYPPCLYQFFYDNFTKCLRERRPWQHFFECSSAAVFRKFCMHSYPLGNAAGILVVNSLVRTSLHRGIFHEPLDILYRDADGIATQCSHCRKIQRCDSVEQWDFVPAWVRSIPDNLSHGLCKPCLGFYYSPTGDFDNGFPKCFTTGAG
jgi:hypothetical protein